MLRLVRVFIWAAVCCLSACAASGQAADEMMQLPLPEISVSMTPTPPEIDGKIDENEWRYASKTTGFVNLADGLGAEEQTVVYITYDNKQLYLAFDCLLTTERSPAASEATRDGGVWADESFEVFLQPAGRKENEFYHFIGNAIGTIYDDYARDRSWNGRWEFANDSGMGFWHSELSISFSELGTGAPMGETWRVNFARNLGKHTSWSYTGRGYMNPPRFGIMRFAEAGMVLQIHAIKGLHGGSVNVGGSVFNAGTEQAGGIFGVRAKDFETDIKENVKLGTRQWKQDMRFNLTAHEKKDFSITRTSAEEGKKLLRICLLDERDEPLYQTAIPFLATAPKYVELLAEPSEETVYARMDLRGLASDRTIDVHVKVESEDGSFSKGLIFDHLPAGKIHTRREDVRNWPLGKYRCRVGLYESGNATPLRESEFSHECRKPPEWYTVGKDLGYSDKVQKPWTPIGLDGDILNVWGREHNFGQELFLKQVKSSGEAILSGPVALEGMVGGRKCRSTFVRRSIIHQAPNVVVMRSEGKLGALDVQVEASVEYDGLMKFELDLTSRAPVVVDALRLIVPLKKERALYGHYASSYYGRAWSGSVPPEGLKMVFRPFVWLGDNERGLMWFAESTEGWNCGNEPIEIRPGRSETELRVSFIEEAERIENERTIIFGLQATPVKAVPPDWRAWRVDRVYTSKRRAEKYYVDWEGEGIPLQWRYLWWTDGMTRIFTPGHTTPLQIMPSLGQYAAEVHEEGTRIVPYMYPYGVNRIATDFDRFYPVWQTSSPREMAYWGRVIMGACPASREFADYLLYGISEMVRKYHIDGMYFDGAAPPVSCANQLHGHGWVDENGIRRPFYPIFGLREFYKRLWTILCEHVEDAIIWIHSDGKIAPPAVSFATANWEGECVQGQLKRADICLSDILGLDFCRSHLMATQWGIVPMWLPTIYGTEEQLRRQEADMLALVLIHGTPIGLTGRIDRKLLQKIWKAQAEFDIGRAAFYGYWEHSKGVKITTPLPRVHVSYYVRDGRLLIVAANFADKVQTVPLELDAALADNAASFRDCISDGDVPIEKRRVRITVDAHSFKMLVTQMKGG